MPNDAESPPIAPGKNTQIDRLPDGAFRLRTSLDLARPIDEVFDFFCRAENLQRITPPWLGFRILTPLPIAMGADTLIDYRIKLHGLPMRWRTKIAVWNPPHEFVDDQLRGPYRQWTHTHRFEAIPGGTRASDEVIYRTPGGALIERLFVRRNVAAIFAYRQQRMIELFGQLFLAT
ncbi:SRPBCC family protein [Planctomycetales bacterium ZRK34]|nr:SRPBCC family protein [Planctomycetales bacterium ZRK34]